MVSFNLSKFVQKHILHTSKSKPLVYTRNNIDNITKQVIKRNGKILKRLA